MRSERVVDRRQPCPCANLAAATTSPGISPNGNCTDFGAGDERCSASGACRVVGEICSASEDCCGFNCTIANGETYGHCETLPGFSECKSVGEICNGDYAVQPDEAVCNKTVNDDVGRCQNPGGDAPAGEVCGDVAGNPQGSNTCAGGQGQGSSNPNCQSSGEGLPYRCTNGDGACKAAGNSCALGLECCSGICAPDSNGDLVCDPVDECRQIGGTCTANGDCCDGFCDPQTLTCQTGVVID